MSLPKNKFHSARFLPHIIAWKICTSMGAQDVTATLTRELEALVLAQGS
jgi:hypothetical protein